MLEKKRDGIVWFCHCKVKRVFLSFFYLFKDIYMGKIELAQLNLTCALSFFSFIFFKDIYGEK